MLAYLKLLLGEFLSLHFFWVVFWAAAWYGTREVWELNYDTASEDF